MAVREVTARPETQQQLHDYAAYQAYVDSGFAERDMPAVRRHQRWMADNSIDHTAGARFDESLALALRPVLDPGTFELPSGDTVSCGLLMDLPKRERRHQWLDAGLDVRHQFSGAFVMCLVRVCARCGRDDATAV